MQNGLKADDRAVRRHSFILAVENPGLDIREVIETAVSDTDVLIRNWAFSFIRNEMPKDWAEFRKCAAGDPFLAIRRMAFESLIGEPSPRTDLPLGFLLDSSPAIRHSAQDLLPKLLNISVPDYYRAELTANRRPRSICALGLAEVGDANDAPSIAAVMPDSSAKTRSAAIRALRILGVTDKESLFKVLHEDVPSVAREAVISLLSARVVSADVIWKEALVNEHPIVWRTVLKLFGRVDKWTRLKVYLEAVAMKDNETSAFAVERLRIWLAHYNRSFTLPHGSDASHISAIFGSARHKLPADVTRGLDFIVKTVLKPVQKT